MKTIGKSTLLVALLTGTAFQGVAQDIYDDIYGTTPAKEKKTADVRKPKETPRALAVTDYPAADTYNFDSGSNRDIDDYNRRGIFAVDTVAASTARNGGEEATADFNCTRQIERFYNPDVVVESNDPTLAQVYYAEPANVNIIINPGWGWNTPYWSGYWGWGNPYYYSSYWGWPSPWYSSWYVGSPYWSWSWGWGYYPGWGYRPGWGYYPGWGGAWAGPGWGWSRPNNPRHPSAWQANRPGGYGRPGMTPNHNGQRPGAVRPGAVGNVNPGYRPGATTATRPGASQTTRPGGAVNSGQRPGATTTTRPGVTTTRPGSSQQTLRPGQLSGGFNTMQRPSTQTQQRVERTYRNGATNGTTVNRRPSTQTQTTQRPPATRQQQNYQQTQQRQQQNYQRPSYQQSRPSYSSPSMGGNRGGGVRSGGSRGGGGRH